MSAAGSSTERESEALRRAQRAHEPSMEEILASIRNIIADDRENARSTARGPVQRTAPASGPQIVYSKDADASPAPRPEAKAGPEADRREPAQAAEVESPRVIWSYPPAAGSKPAVELPLEVAARSDAKGKTEAPLEIDSEAAKPAEPEAPAENPAPVAAIEPIVLDAAAQAGAAEVGAAEPQGEEAPLLSPEAAGAVAFAFTDLSATLARRAEEAADGMIREMLRPLLKDWLDRNMPGVVERLVRAEIERVTRAPR